MEKVYLWIITIVVFFVICHYSLAQSSVTMHQSGIIPESLRNEIISAINRGLDWLVSQQANNGSWSDTNFPALTGLPLWAFAKSKHPACEKVIPKAVDFILSCVRDDGGIYVRIPDRKGGGLSNYNTAICMTALHALGDNKLTGVILNARKFISSSQHFGGDIYEGGFGYDADTKRPYTDLLNTYWAVRAMRETENIEDLRSGGEKKVDIDWSGVVKFVSRLQSPPESGEDNKGGFTYNPSDPKAGTITNAEGKIYFRSYGSMTYAGLLALIYAKVDKNDVRVISAFDWASKHWTLEENPGMGKEGLYFFYNVLTRALDAFGVDRIPAVTGKMIDWRVEVAKKIISLQKIDSATGHGYWVNDVGRYWESNPVLVTAYCILALQDILE